VAIEPEDASLWAVLQVAADSVADYPLARQLFAPIRMAWQQYIAAKPRGWESHMFFVNLVLLLCRRPEAPPLPDPTTIPAYVQEYDARAVPDYAVDMHTGRGRKMARGIEHFLAEGMWEPDERYADDYRDRFCAVCREYEGRKGRGASTQTAPPPQVVVPDPQLRMFDDPPA
jgi:hypothetical protein